MTAFGPANFHHFLLVVAAADNTVVVAAANNAVVVAAADNAVVVDSAAVVVSSTVAVVNADRSDRQDEWAMVAVSNGTRRRQGCSMTAGYENLVIL